MMDISDKNLKRAGELHREMEVVDMHRDLPGELLFRHRSGEREILKRRYLKRWKAAGVRVVVCSVYLEDDVLPDGALRNTLLQIASLQEEVESLRGQGILIRDRDDLERARREGAIGFLLYLEGLDGMGTDIGLLQLFHQMGVRGAALTWSRRNSLATGCCRANEHRETHGGISESGWETIGRMTELGWFLDISHLNDDGTGQILGLHGSVAGKKVPHLPVIATHSDARAVCSHYRNLTDAQIGSLAERGGIIGINAYSRLAGSHESGDHLEALYRQAAYLIDRAGEDHVCYGLDLCHSYEMARREIEEEGRGMDCLSDYDELISLTAYLLEKGMTEQQIRKLSGENALRFLERIL